MYPHRVPGPSSATGARALRLQHRLLRRYLRLWARLARRRVARFYHRDLILKTENFAHVTWLGEPVWQNVLDLWTIQETIAALKPALLVEVGTHRAGSTLFYAHLMDLIGAGRVLTVDIAKRHAVEHPRIDFVLGDSTDRTVVEHVQAAAADAAGPVMVILDGDHRRAHVAEELELYAPLVTPGSFLLSQDGVIDELAWFANGRPGPLGANRDFLERHPEFEHDIERNERFILTHHPLGWMRRR